MMFWINIYLSFVKRLQYQKQHNRGGCKIPTLIKDTIQMLIKLNKQLQN